jgi:hypothetical protein
MSRAAIGRRALHQVDLIISVGQFPVVEVRCERHEPGCTEAIRHLLDAGIEAPPFLDDQHTGTGARLRRDQVP